MINEQIADYRLIEKIGRGGFGNVYKGQHVRLENRFVAVKIFIGNVDSDEECHKFIQEAHILDQIRHPHIVQVLDCGIHHQSDLRRPYLITEFALGGSLDRRLEQTDSVLAFEQSLSILSQVGQALQFAHDHDVLHGDLKPANILFSSTDEALLADFGISVVLQSSRTKHGFYAGTLEYMAPEVFDGEGSAQSDQYSLACMAYELFTGNPVFPVPDSSKRAHFLASQHMFQQPRLPSSVNPELPETIDSVLLQALNKNPANRYPNIDTFLRYLQLAFQRPRLQETLRQTRKIPSSMGRLSPPLGVRHAQLSPRQQRMLPRQQSAIRIPRAAHPPRRVPPPRRVSPRIYDIEDDQDNGKFIYQHLSFPDESLFDPSRAARPHPRIHMADNIQSIRPVNRGSLYPQRVDATRRVRPVHTSSPENVRRIQARQPDKASFFKRFYRWMIICISPFFFVLTLSAWISFPYDFSSWCYALVTLLLLSCSLYNTAVDMLSARSLWWRLSTIFSIVLFTIGVLQTLTSRSVFPSFLFLLLLVTLSSIYRWKL